MNLRLSRFTLLLTSFLLVCASSAQADCRTDNIACSNKCILPGMAGIFGKQSSDRVLQQCLSGCESAKRQCDMVEAQEKRRQEMEEARNARAAAQQQAVRQQEQQSAQQAEAQQFTLLRQRYPGKLVFRTEQLLTGQDDSLPVVTRVENLQTENTLLNDHLFYIDKSSVLHVINLKTGASKSMTIPGSFGVVQAGEGKDRAAIVKSVQPGDRQMILQAFNTQAQPASAQIKTGMPAFVGSKKGESDRSILLSLRGTTLYAYNFVSAYVHEGKDNTPLEARSFDLRSGNQLHAFSAGDARTMSLSFYRDQARVYSVDKWANAATAHDFVTQTKLFEQPLKLGRFSEKDHIWIFGMESMSSFYVNTRSNDQKTQSYAWFSAESGAPGCSFSGAASYHDKLKLFANGHRLFDLQCNQVGEINEARNGELYQLGDGWMAWYPSQNYLRRAFDAQGKVLTDLYNEIQVMPQGALLLFKNKEPVRVLDRNRNLRTLSVIGGSYPRLLDDYIVWSNFEQGYQVTVARYNDETPVANFLREQNKDEYETTAAYRQRIARLTAPFSRDVQLGTYNADNQTLPVIIDNVVTDIRVPAAQARRLKEQPSVRLQGKVKLLEAGVVEVIDGTLSGGATSFKIAASKGSVR